MAYFRVANLNIAAIHRTALMGDSKDPYETDDEGYMILSTDDFENDTIEWPIGTEAPSKYCECMIPEVAIYLGLNKSVEYCKSCKKDMPPHDESGT